MEMAEKPIPPNSIFDADAILEYIDYPGKKELVKRRSLVANMSRELDEAKLRMADMGAKIENQVKELNARDDKIADNEIKHHIEVESLKAAHEIEIDKIQAAVEIATNKGKSQ